MFVGLQIADHVNIFFTTRRLLYCDVGKWREQEPLGSRVWLGPVSCVMASMVVFKVNNTIVGFELDHSTIQHFHPSCSLSLHCSPKSGPPPFFIGHVVTFLLFSYMLLSTTLVSTSSTLHMYHMNTLLPDLSNMVDIIKCF